MFRGRGLPGRSQERGNIIKEGVVQNGHIIEDGVVGPGHPFNSAACVLFPKPVSPSWNFI